MPRMSANCPPLSRLVTALLYFPVLAAGICLAAGVLLTTPLILMLLAIGELFRERPAPTSAG